MTNKIIHGTTVFVNTTSIPWERLCPAGIAPEAFAALHKDAQASLILGELILQGALALGFKPLELHPIGISAHLCDETPESILEETEENYTELEQLPSRGHH